MKLQHYNQIQNMKLQHFNQIQTWNYVRISAHVFSATLQSVAQINTATTRQNYQLHIYRKYNCDNVSNDTLNWGFNKHQRNELD